MLQEHLRFIKRISFLLLIYSLLRLGFYFYHHNIFSHFTSSELLQSFLLGIRFDIAGILMLNLPILVLALFELNRWQKIERIIFIILNSLGILATIDDYELFLFFGKRLSYDLFVIGKDITDQLPQLITYYWYFPILSLLGGISLYFIDKKYFYYKSDTSTYLKRISLGLILMIMTFIGIRGGLQHKSISVQSAFVQGSNELGHLVMNTPYHFFRTLKNKNQKKLNFFSDDQKAFEFLKTHRNLNTASVSVNQKNVIILILESFSQEYFENGYMPFLKELEKDSSSFKRHLANGRRSIEVLPSILCGLPSLINEPISTSIYQSNKFSCFPKILKENGYTNYFFHGGSRGTMGFESYTLSNGFDRYFSREDYPSEKDFDGTWGIFDGPFMEYSIDQIDLIKKPFLVGIFTLSSHQPYSIPLTYKGKFPKGSLEIHESIGYTDFALKSFFEKARAREWFKDTIFIITADHTSKLESKKFNNMIGRYRVPLIVYPMLQGANESKISQHSDIPKTILHLLGINNDTLPLTGQSLLNRGEGLAVNFSDGRDYFLLTNQDSFLFNGVEQRRFTYNWDTGEILLGEASENLMLKAYLQYFLNGLITNNLSSYQ
jgi:uncharacterized sulfatase